MSAWSWVGVHSGMVTCCARQIRAGATCRRCPYRSMVCRIQVERPVPSTSTPPPRAGWHWSDYPGYNRAWLRAVGMRTKRAPPTCRCAMLRTVGSHLSRATAAQAGQVIALRACAHRWKRCTMRARPGMWHRLLSLSFAHCGRTTRDGTPPCRRQHRQRHHQPLPGQPRQAPTTTSPSGTS